VNASLVIKGLRRSRMKTQNDLAKYLNVSRTTYFNYEQEPLKYNLKVWMKVMEYLECTDLEFNKFLNALKQDYLSYKK